MAAPNIVNVTSIYGKTRGQDLTTTTNAGILTCASNKVLKVNSIIVANIDGTNTADATISFFDNDQSGTFLLASTVSVPADSTLVVIGKDSPIYLEESDEIRGGAGADGDLEVIISYEELDDA
jgi:hypothetical protein|tara:strand:+ start:1900 stop:2268 length:369 start_codon:yes stop_codon:yes gene_type:complete